MEVARDDRGMAQDLPTTGASSKSSARNCRNPVVVSGMDKQEKKTLCGPALAPEVMRPLGSNKAARFSEVEGLRLNAEAKSMASALRAQGLSEAGYRAEITKRFQANRSRT